MNDIITNILRSQGIEELLPLKIDAHNGLYCYKKDDRYRFCNSELQEISLQELANFILDDDAEQVYKSFFYLEHNENHYRLLSIRHETSNAKLINQDGFVVRENISKCLWINGCLIIGIDKEYYPDRDSDSPFILDVQRLSNEYECVTDDETLKGEQYICSFNGNFHLFRESGKYIIYEWHWTYKRIVEVIDSVESELYVWCRKNNTPIFLIIEQDTWRREQHIRVLSSFAYPNDDEEIEKKTIGGIYYMLDSKRVLCSRRDCVIELEDLENEELPRVYVRVSDSGDICTSHDYYGYKEKLSNSILRRRCGEYLIFETPSKYDSSEHAHSKYYTICNDYFQEVGKSDEDTGGVVISFLGMQGVLDLETGTYIIPNHIFNEIEIENVYNGNEVDVFSIVKLKYNVPDEEVVLQGLFHNSKLEIPIGQYVIRRVEEGKYEIVE